MEKTWDMEQLLMEVDGKFRDLPLQRSTKDSVQDCSEVVE